MEKTTSAVKSSNVISNTIEHVKMEGTNKVNILTHKPGKRVYVVGNFRGCGSCKYVLTQLEKIMRSNTTTNIKYYFVEKDDCNLKVTPTPKNPTVFFVEDKEIKSTLVGVIPNIKDFLIAFDKGEEIPDASKVSHQLKENIINRKVENTYSHKVVTIKKEKKCIYESYKNYLESNKVDLKDVINVTTFIDPDTKDLIVTFTFKPKPVVIGDKHSFISFS